MMRRAMQAVARSCRVSAGTAHPPRAAGQGPVGREAGSRERKAGAERHSLLHLAMGAGSFLWQEVISE